MQFTAPHIKPQSNFENPTSELTCTETAIFITDAGFAYFVFLECYSCFYCCIEIYMAASKLTRYVLDIVL